MVKRPLRTRESGVFTQPRPEADVFMRSRIQMKSYVFAVSNSLVVVASASFEAMVENCEE